MSTTLLDKSNPVNNRLERIWLLAKIEFKLRYYENKLGLLWALIKPITNLIIYFVAFKIILKSNVENFEIYLFSGIIIWEFFMESTAGLTGILQTKKYLYEYSNMSKIEIYLASMFSISLGFGFNFIILLFFLFFGGIGIGVNILFLPLIFLIVFIYSLGLALILSNLFIVAKDISQIWPLISHLMMWASPLFFDAIILKDAIPGISSINPMFGIMTNFRNATMYNLPPDYELLGINVIQALFILCLGLICLNRIGKKASEIL
jgi:ABC-type polysaccharide/polyol phosphate export permease